MAKPLRLLVVMSDLHCGSTCAIMPAEFETHEGQTIKPNAVQRWLLDCWNRGINEWLPTVTGGDPFGLVLNGDLIEGNHHGTKEIISPELIDHRDAALALLKPLAKDAAATYIIEGTECHVGNIEHTLARSLGAVPDPDTKKPAWGRLDITVADTRCIFQHHITTAIRPYLEASGLGIALGTEQLEAAKNGERIPRVLGSAHRHRYGEYRDATGLSFVTGPWQMLTRHGRKVVASARTRPTISILDWRNRDNDSVPETHVISFSPPSPKGARL